MTFEMKGVALQKVLESQLGPFLSSSHSLATSRNFWNVGGKPRAQEASLCAKPSPELRAAAERTGRHLLGSPAVNGVVLQRRG